MSVGGVTPTELWQIVKQSFTQEEEKIDEKKSEVTSLEDKQMAYDNVDNILEELRTSLANFTKKSTFISRNVSTSDSEVVVASANSTAPETSFHFSSITQLATSARVTSSSAFGLTSGTSPYRVSTADINDGTDYNPNLPISNAQDGMQITSGSFTLNDINISIDGDDTLNTILTKINNSGAGVIAVFDTATDTVRLSGTIVGADEEITVSDGGTNFFTALNLTTTIAGTDPEWEQPLADSSLSGIAAGYFTINNFTFYVDPSTESLDSVMRKVNNSNSGVTMYYDEVSNKVTMQQKTEGKPLLLANDTSGFLTTLGLLNQGGDQDASADYSRYEGQDAIFTLNGETLTRETNTFTIQGITFSLLGTSDTGATINVSQDRESAAEVAKSFVSQFNASIAAIDSIIDAEDGPLEGDSTLRNIKMQLLNDVLSTVSNPGQYTSLVDIGFGVERGGGTFSLTLDEEKFMDKIDDDELSLHQLFAYDADGDALLDDGGYAISTRSYLENYTRSVSGFFYKRNDYLFDRISDLNMTILTMEERLTKKEERKFYELADQVTQLQKMQQQQEQLSQSQSALGL